MLKALAMETNLAGSVGVGANDGALTLVALDLVLLNDIECRPPVILRLPSFAFELLYKDGINQRAIQTST